MKIESGTFEKSHLTESIDIPAGCQSSGHPLSSAVNQQLKGSINHLHEQSFTVSMHKKKHIKNHSIARDNKVYSLITNLFVTIISCNEPERN